MFYAFLLILCNDFWKTESIADNNILFSYQIYSHNESVFHPVTHRQTVYIFLAHKMFYLVLWDLRPALGSSQCEYSEVYECESGCFVNESINLSAKRSQNK